VCAVSALLHVAQAPEVHSHEIAREHHLEHLRQPHKSRRGARLDRKDVVRLERRVGAAARRRERRDRVDAVELDAHLDRVLRHLDGVDLHARTSFEKLCIDGRTLTARGRLDQKQLCITHSRTICA
jgi:hypothetical protein